MKDLYMYAGGEYSYEIFISFVRDILSQAMSMQFKEEEYYKELWRHFFQEQYNVTEIARGHSKSEFGCWVSVYRAVYKPNNPFSEKCIQQQLIVSADSQTTAELNNRVATFFFDCDELRQFLPMGMKQGQQNPRWNRATLEFRNKSVIHFRSIKTKRGLHVDSIWVDDPTTESSTLTDIQTIDFVMGAILPMGTNKDAIVNFTGTPLRITDILSVMSSKHLYNSVKMPAIKEDGTLLSPNRFSEKSINDIKMTIGTTKFSCEYLLNPIDDSVSLIKRDWITQCFDERYDKRDYEFDAVYLGVDFAFSDRITSDHSAFVDIGVVRDGERVEYHLLNYRRERGLSVTRQMEIIGLMYATQGYDMIALEENSIKSVSADIREMGLPVKMFWTGNRDERDIAGRNSNMPTKTHSISKMNAINRLAITLENANWRIPYVTDKEINAANTLLNELTSWALEEGRLVEIGMHPDGPMAIIMAMSLLDVNNVIVV